MKMENYQPNSFTAHEMAAQNTNNSAKAVPEKRRKILSAEAREVVLHVLLMCEAERDRDALLKPLNEFSARAAAYTGITEETLKDLKHKCFVKPKECPEPKKPGVKERKKQLNETIILNDRDIIKIKDIIRDYYITNCKVPSVKDLLPCVLHQIPIYENNIKFLKTVLHNIGYRKKKLSSHQTILVEDPTAVSYRDEYLKMARKLRNQTKNTFYVYECIIDSSYTFYKSWVQKFGDNQVLQNEQTYVFICAASVNGFLKGATMVCKPRLSDNSSEHNMMTTLFEKWLKEHLIPRLPEVSVIVMDDAPHHCAVANKPLSYCASKEEMMVYLRKKNIKCDETMRHIELYRLIESNVPYNKVYIVDDILKVHQHRTLRLPPYMVDLNPTQLAMDQIQQKLYESDYNGSFKLRNVAEIIVQLMDTISQDEWDMLFEKVQSLEDDYWKKDEAFEVVMDKILQNLNNCENSDSDKSSVNSDEEYL